ncbi:hypothetical protein NDU88_004859 [Pleurodeles waltl]|uniref:Reverse transcriptase domain-containing protein n=1 Tax=Pleurodeles waltl TaxID=8319 RepID=A0AAV7RHF0_PLEWA|nr:hypothetical protein NDU88_004859 [Pleurodeles waltl]
MRRSDKLQQSNQYMWTYCTCAMSILSLQPTPSICEETVQVMNLSSLQLSMHEINVLKKGLGFCPSSKPDYTNIHIDLFKFIRNLKLKKFFHNKPDTNKNAHTAPPTCNQTIGDLQDIHTVLSLDNTYSPSPSFDELLVQLNVIPNLDVNSGLKPNSMFVPTLPPDNHIDVFYQAVSTELYNLEDKRSTRTHRPSNNLNSEELRALHKLSICPDIIITRSRVYRTAHHYATTRSFYRLIRAFSYLRFHASLLHTHLQLPGAAIPISVLYHLLRLLNMAFFDDNRDTLAAELFSKKPLAPRTTDPTPSTQGLRQKFIKLERLRKQELARWWDITTLKRYLEIKQVPRGLRVIIFPSFEDLDPDLLGEWEHLISSTSFSMINILIKHSDRKRTKLLLDITSLEEEIKNLNLPEATDKNYTIMREILTGYQLYIKDKKMRKLVRDDNDYKNGRIYTFARKFDQGLGFCPSSKPDYTNIHIDLFKFIRNLKLKKFFHNKPDTNKNAHTAPPTCNQTIGDLQDIHTVLSLDNTYSPSPSFDELLVQLNVIPNLDVNSGLKPNSMFVPTLPPDNHIDVFYQAVSTELYNLEDKRSTRTHRPSNNLNSEELRALHKLSICPDIVIREADKGGNVVVMNRSDYVAEIDRQLNDTQAYSLLPSNPLSNITSMIKKKLTFWRNHCLLTDLEYRFLYIEAPRAPCIYILPKVHKPGGFPPGRPIISGIGSPTEHISEYIDSFLQPLVHNLPSYIQDTRDLLCQLEDIDWSEDFMFVCLDVSSLYTSIPLERGLEMLQRTLNTRDATLFDHTRMLLDLTRLVLENNVFLHDGRWYRQCQGVAMGAKFSPSYANLYMGQFEKKHLWSNCPPDLTEHILYWGRYIDDILAIWTGNVSDLNILIKHLNTNDFNLVFTHKMDTTKIEFLDLLLYITDNKIMSRLYRKPTACNSVLHAHSAHPLSQIRAIPYGEMIYIQDGRRFHPFSPVTPKRVVSAAYLT